ncbi:DUF4255 domain-containing protein [Nitrosomonas supralitoralis]|uniref:DUF4255 domain-containing protein n=1 Tax=Nitrosomonas supralitoralis TaxID=2116706 RepID=A0A2P7NZQ9_9PROT|nr:DUF4255 domain-containing protein [Nitrosomonas supralitoralis]PSJ18972.1 DUF4255 domain-containing protein [Nitrosomonas supralitoralis]
MINLAVQLLATQLNQYLRRTYNLGEDVVVVSNLLEMDGSMAANVNNKLVIFLVNIEKDAIPFRQVKSHEVRQLEMQSVAPFYFNLYLMMTANFTGNHYSEALKFLSSTISFFQRNYVINRQIAPEMDARIEKLILDIENLSIQDLSNLWGALGGKYLPSILYRVRMVAFDAEDIAGRIPLVSEPKPSVQ